MATTDAATIIAEGFTFWDTNNIMAQRILEKNVHIRHNVILSGCSGIRIKIHLNPRLDLVIYCSYFVAVFDRMTP
jgi:hypothetical protein